MSSGGSDENSQDGRPGSSQRESFGDWQLTPPQSPTSPHSPMPLTNLSALPPTLVDSEPQDHPPPEQSGAMKPSQRTPTVPRRSHTRTPSSPSTSKVPTRRLSSTQHTSERSSIVPPTKYAQRMKDFDSAVVRKLEEEAAEGDEEYAAAAGRASNESGARGLERMHDGVESDRSSRSS